MLTKGFEISTPHEKLDTETTAHFETEKRFLVHFETNRAGFALLQTQYKLRPQVQVHGYQYAVHCAQLAGGYFST